MSSLLLVPSVIAPFFIECLLFSLLSYATFYTLVLLKNSTQKKYTQHYYQLEEKSHLVITIISLALFIQIALLPLFFYTLDNLSTLLIGAMCSAGVISANSFGNPTLFLKIFTIFLALLWLQLNKKDEITPKQPYFRQKLYLYLFIYLLLGIELFLEFSFFSNLSTQTPVLCCSSLYTLDDAKSFRFSNIELLLLFSSLFVATILLNYYQKRYISTLFALFFVVSAYLALLSFFSPYIYELPTHQCPYCMMKKEYHFIGYFLYFSLFMGFYYSTLTLFLKNPTKEYKKSSLFFLLFFLLSLSPFLLYILKNQTLLTPLV